jgi:hypothetical protein
LNAATAAAYYLRVIGTMYFRPATSTPPAEGGPGTLVAVTACIVLVIAVGVMPGVVLQDAERADPLMQQNAELLMVSPDLQQSGDLPVQLSTRGAAPTSFLQPSR